MKSVGVVAGVALTIALSFFALTCAAKSPPLGSPSPNLHLPLRTVHDIALTGGMGWISLPVAFSQGDGSFSVTNTLIDGFATFATQPGATVVSTPAMSTH